jgi:hypothetical protein
VHAALDDLVTTLYVEVDDLLKAHPERLPERPTVGFAPKITDAELVTLAVLQAVLGYPSERRWLRHAHEQLTGWFPYLPGQSGYNKRLRKLAPTFAWLIATLAARTSIADDDVWGVDSTPVECARSRETVKRSELAGFAEYGYCASHSRFFWDCGYTCWPPCTACRSGGHSPARKPTNVTPSPTSWPASR